ncbi:hypothetical protein EBPHNEJP_00174 [Salmonella phage CF-SP2]|nr:hypothetical protein EBPHNEJP_00174 [Salmonella phage CF-SP2]
MKAYTREEYFKVIDKINELAQTLRQYELNDDNKDHLTSLMRTMISTLAFEVTD